MGDFSNKIPYFFGRKFNNRLKLTCGRGQSSANNTTVGNRDFPARSRSFSHRIGIYWVVHKKCINTLNIDRATGRFRKRLALIIAVYSSHVKHYVQLFNMITIHCKGRLVIFITVQLLYLRKMCPLDVFVQHMHNLRLTCVQNFNHCWCRCCITAGDCLVVDSSDLSVKFYWLSSSPIGDSCPVLDISWTLDAMRLVTVNSAVCCRFSTFSHICMVFW